MSSLGGQPTSALSFFSSAALSAFSLTDNVKIHRMVRRDTFSTSFDPNPTVTGGRNLGGKLACCFDPRDRIGDASLQERPVKSYDERFISPRDHRIRLFGRMRHAAEKN